jgi:hypothetical protein
VAKVEKIERMPSQMKQAKSLLNSLHPNAWPDVRAELEEAIKTGDFSKTVLNYHEHQPINVIRKIKYNRDEVAKQIQDAFDNCKAFRWHQDTYRHTGRDLSIEVKPTEDGKGVRAWFSSEFMGCGNGDYFIMINPTTATSKERD